MAATHRVITSKAEGICAHNFNIGEEVQLIPHPHPLSDACIGGSELYINKDRIVQLLNIDDVEKLDE